MVTPTSPMMFLALHARHPQLVCNDYALRVPTTVAGVQQHRLCAVIGQSKKAAPQLLQGAMHASHTARRVITMVRSAVTGNCTYGTHHPTRQAPLNTCLPTGNSCLPPCPQASAVYYSGMSTQQHSPGKPHVWAYTYRYIQQLRLINALEQPMAALTDEELAAHTADFRARLAGGTPLDSLLVEAFAVVREASKRVLGMRPYDVQLVCSRVP